MATLRGDARLAANFSPVDCDKIVREGIKRELETMVLKEEYNFIDPRHSSFITDKPTAVQLDAYMSDGDLPKEYIAVAASASLTPKEKYDAPMTEAQEIGWYASEAAAPSQTTRRFTHRSQQSEMTKHANALTKANWSNIRR